MSCGQTCHLVLSIHLRKPGVRRLGEKKADAGRFAFALKLAYHSLYGNEDIAGYS